MAPPETLTEAAARVQRLVSGGDDEVRTRNWGLLFKTLQQPDLRALA